VRIKALRKKIMKHRAEARDIYLRETDEESMRHYNQTEKTQQVVPGQKTVAGSVNISTAQMILRGRGRPRKILSLQPVKRGRGRPRKIVSLLGIR
jgi:hypothetical protein